MCTKDDKEHFIFLKEDACVLDNFTTLWKVSEYHDEKIQVGNRAFIATVEAPTSQQAISAIFSMWTSNKDPDTKS